MTTATGNPPTTRPVYEYAWVHYLDVLARLAAGWEYPPTYVTGDLSFVLLRRVVAWTQVAEDKV